MTRRWKTAGKIHRRENTPRRRCPVQVRTPAGRAARVEVETLEHTLPKDIRIIFLFTPNQVKERIGERRAFTHSYIKVRAK